MMRDLVLLSSLGFSLVGTSLSAQEILVAAWDFSNVDGTFNGNTVAANVSDLFPGDGESIDGAAGTLYMDGTNGSSLIDNSGALSIVTSPGNSAFSADVPTQSRPLSVDLDAVDGAPIRLAFADGTFGGGGDADPSGKYLVFVANAPAGESFTSDIRFSIALGADGTATTLVGYGYSYDGVNFTDLGSVDATQVDMLGPNFTLTDGVGESSVYVRLQVPTMAFGSFTMDNAYFVAEVGLADPSSWWGASPANGNGWRFSGQGYDGENGIGWIWDQYWPWVYAGGLGGDPATGDWIYVHADGGSRSGFYAYVNDGGYWIWASGVWGWYYSFESGKEGWTQLVW